MVCLLACLISVVAATPSLNLDCALDPPAHKMHVRVETTVQPDWIKAGRCEFRLGKAMTLPEVSILDGTRKIKAELKSEPDKSDVKYTVSLATGTAATARLEFVYDNAANDDFVFHVGPEGTFAGGYNTTWYPTFDDQRSVGRMSFSVPPGYVVKASGRQEPPAADGSQKFDVEKPTVLTFAAAKYVVKKIEGKVPITVYLLRDRPGAEAYARGCFKILNVLQSAFGPYPLPDFAIIETPSPISVKDGFSGASFEGFMFGDSDSLDAPFNLAYFAHEMSHQWWGNLVHSTGKGGGDLLSEGLAQYGSLLAVEAIDGPDGAAMYRSNGYPGYSSSQSGHGAIMDAATDFDAPLGETDSGSPYAHEFACSKGFLVWDSLARRMGRPRFHAALQWVASKFGGGEVTFAQFLQALKDHSPVDLTQDIDQWLYRKGVPCLALKWSQTGARCRVTLSQASPEYRLDIQIEAVLDGGRYIRRIVHIDSTQAVDEFDVPRDVRKVLLDPGFEILHSTPDLQREAQASRFLTQGFLLFLEGKMDEARKQCEQGLATLKDPDPYGVEFQLRNLEGGIDHRSGKLDAAKTSYSAALACPVRIAPVLPYLYLRLATIAKGQHDDVGLAAALKGLQSTDGALTTPSGALDMARAAGLL